MFHDEVDAILFIDDFKEFDYIFVVDVSENIDFVLECCFNMSKKIGMGILHIRKFDFFDCVRKAVINLPERSRSDDLFKAIFVVANYV